MPKDLEHTAEGHERCSGLLEHVPPVDADVLLAVGTLMRMPEAQSVSGFVGHNIFLKPLPSNYFR